MQNEDDLVTVYRDARSVPFDRLQVLLRAVPMPELLALTNDAISERTIERARGDKGRAHRATQTLLIRAIVEYFSTHPAPTFATIERLDPQRVAADLRKRAEAIRAESGGPIGRYEALDRARRELASATDEQLRVALISLGLG